MLKKGQPVKFTRPASTMRQVLGAIEQGVRYRVDIIEFTELQPGQVRSAINNLMLIGAIYSIRDRSGRATYEVAGRWEGVAHSLKGVSFIFNLCTTNK